MAGEIVLTVVGNLTADPEVRYTQGGKAVANFTIASTPRIFDKQKNEWVDGDPVFLRCSVWGDYAENVSVSLTKGMRVIAQGRYSQRAYEDRDGNKRTSTELSVDEIGPSLRYAQAAVQRVQRGHTPQYGLAQAAADEAWENASDTWATPEPSQAGTEQPAQAKPETIWQDPQPTAFSDEETPF